MCTVIHSVYFLKWFLVKINNCIVINKTLIYLSNQYCIMVLFQCSLEQWFPKGGCNTWLGIRAARAVLFLDLKKCVRLGFLNLPKCPGIGFCSIHCVHYCIKALRGTVFLIPLPPAFWTACSCKRCNIVYNFHASGLPNLIFLHGIGLHLNWRVDLIWCSRGLKVWNIA